MRFLLDTNILIRAIEERLREQSLTLLADRNNELYVSDVSLWEIAIKTGLGKLALPDDLDHQMAILGMTGLAITRDHISGYRELPLIHRDPFDRMLIAQAKTENLVIVTADRRFAEYDIGVMPA